MLRRLKWAPEPPMAPVTVECHVERFIDLLWNGIGEDPGPT
jgi:hypothetical protein